MGPDKLLPALWPLLHGFGINPRGLAPAPNYEFEIGRHTLFVAVESSGQVLLVTPLSRGTTSADDDVGWRILNQNTFGQPAPILIHSASGNAEEVLLWCEFSLLTLPSDQLRALPERFLARLLKTQSLLEGVEPNGPGMAEQTAAKPQRRQPATATQLRERLDRHAA
ncbi:CesT family type III secretion system chaperone [Massilia rubra]|uniref:Tir chaperone family protein n=1 Tax=Massilia rubra TaxID=2607910 RepID=A0ABX0LIZ5_9BURK|nr:CesT family type III secretion system chaperone [Massilia rubra]NHZ32643.1 hypothetical protein [Massilia rubra]